MEQSAEKDPNKRLAAMFARFSHCITVHSRLGNVGITKGPLCGQNLSIELYALYGKYLLSAKKMLELKRGFMKQAKIEFWAECVAVLVVN